MNLNRKYTCLDSASDHTVVQLRSNDGKAAILVQMTAVIGSRRKPRG
ncbi:MAG: hypothetical protein LC778_07475 [Acidobacteria bacterium]|nr:hypothetical protein [Acidobacteriota bacterium]